MPLIKCPECENEMSDKVDTVCSKCGYKHDQKNITIMTAKNRTPAQWFRLIFLCHRIYLVFTIFILALFGVKGGGLVFGSILLLSIWYLWISTSQYLVKNIKLFFIVWNTLCLFIVASGILYKI